MHLTDMHACRDMNAAEASSLNHRTKFQLREIFSLDFIFLAKDSSKATRLRQIKLHLFILGATFTHCASFFSSTTTLSSAWASWFLLGQALSRV